MTWNISAQVEGLKSRSRLTVTSRDSFRLGNIVSEATYRRQDLISRAVILNRIYICRINAKVLFVKCALRASCHQM